MIVVQFSMCLKFNEILIHSCTLYYESLAFNNFSLLISKDYFKVLFSNIKLIDAEYDYFFTS